MLATSPCSRLTPFAARCGAMILVAASMLLNSALAVAQSDNAPTMPRSIEERLASTFMDDARDMLRAPQTTMELLRGADVLLKRVVELDPDNLEAWMLISKVATLADDRASQVAATERLIEIDPKNDVARVMRLTQLAEEFQTVEDRVAFLTSLVDRARSGALEPTTGSRLALECALLHRRAGNTEAFGAMLATAVELDSSNRRAAALATGYFRANINDPVAEAELFAGLLMADPTDLRVSDELAAILLDHGAYEGAERILAMVVEARRATGMNPPDDLLADWALAAWGRGDPEMAMRIIRIRQQERNLLARERIRASQADITRAELNTVTGPLSPSLEAVRLAIFERMRPEFVEGSYDSMLESYKRLIQYLVQQRGSGAMQAAADEVITMRFLEAAWMCIWLGSDQPEVSVQVAAFLDQANAIITLTPEARARFDGWRAIQQGRYEDAIAGLTPLAENDVPAMLGIAVAQLELGQQRSGARSLLNVIRAEPGTLIGVWAGERLTELIGQRLPISDEAEAMETLMASVPRALDRFPSDPTMAVGLRVEPRSSTFGPHDPILVDVRLTNNAPFPLALDPDGPIRPQIVLEANYRISGVTNDLATDPSPVIIDMDRRLRLKPGESHTATIDLRQSDIGTYFRRYRLRGGFIRIRAAVNFNVRLVKSGDIRRPVFQPGLLGTETLVPAFRVEGIERMPLEPENPRETRDAAVRDAQMQQWLDEALIQLTGAPNDDTVLDLITVASHLADPVDPTVEFFRNDRLALDRAARERLAASRSQRAIEAGPALTEVWQQLSPQEQALFISESNWIPFNATTGIVIMARESLSPDVLMATMLQTINDPSDEWLAEMREHEDERVRTLAEGVTMMRELGLTPELYGGERSGG